MIQKTFQLLEIMGFRLFQNFDSPYKAINVADFWRRWHRSLGAWLRNYLYIPLGGNKNGLLNTIRNIFIVMFIGGLWHGASINFIIWGMLHAFFLIIEKIGFALKHGTKLGWLIAPKERHILTFQEQTFHSHQGMDILPMLEIFEDWQLSVQDVFNLLKFV